MSIVDNGSVECDAALFKYLEPALEKNPNGAAVICTFQHPDHLWELASDGNSKPESECLSWSFSQLHRAASRLSVALHGHGVTVDSRVASIMPNGVEWATVLWASKILKTGFSSLDHTALSNPRTAELTGLITTLEPDVVFVADHEAAVYAEKAVQSAGIKPLVKAVFSGRPFLDGWVNVMDLVDPVKENMATLDDLIEQARIDDGKRLDLAVFTSGTTGKPKCCPRTSRNTACSVMGTMDPTQQLNPAARFCIYTANCRIAASSSTFWAWTRGAAIVIPCVAFDPEAVIQAIEKHYAVAILFSAASLDTVVTHKSFGARTSAIVRATGISGDIAARETLLRLQRVFPQAYVIVQYGMAEGAIGTFKWPYAPGDQNVAFHNDVSPIGVVQKGHAAKVADANNNPLPRGETGDLHISSGTVISHYMDKEEPDLFYKDEEGRAWFKTGDTAMVNDQGLFYVLGRTKDMMRRNGLPISPARLESCVDAYTGSLSSVIGIPDPIIGQDPFVVLRDLGGKSATEIKDHALETLGPDYRVRGVATLEQLGLKDFPLNDNNKFVKRELLGYVQEFLPRMLNGNYIERKFTTA